MQYTQRNLLYAGLAKSVPLTGYIDADGIQEAAELAVRESRRPQAEVIVAEGHQ